MLRSLCVSCAASCVQALLTGSRDDGRPWPRSSHSPGDMRDIDVGGGEGAESVAELVEQRAMAQWQGILRFLVRAACPC